MTRCSSGLLAALWLASAGPVAAAEAGYPQPLGFSPDGTRFAFAEWGVQDGSGFSFANLYVIDIAADRYAARPVRVVIKDETAAANQALRQAKERAAEALEDAAITLPARLVYAAPFALPDDDASLQTVPVRWRDPVGVGAEAGAFDLSLSRFPLPGRDCGYDQFGFALALDGVEFYRDAALPGSRYCPVGYTLERVYLADMVWPEPVAVALIGVHSPGFEGLNLRHIAVPIPLDRIGSLD